MDEMKDKALLVSDDAFAADLREALNRREAKRPEVEVPADFLAGIMRQVEPERTHAKAKTWHIALVTVAVAACTLTAVLLVWPKGVEQESAGGELSVRTERAPGPLPVNLQLVATEKGVSSKPVARMHAEKKHVPRQQIAQAESNDELDHYMAELENGLEDVRDSCYLAQVEHMISDNEELQRLLNEMTNQKK